MLYNFPYENFVKKCIIFQKIFKKKISWFNNKIQILKWRFIFPIIIYNSLKEFTLFFVEICTNFNKPNIFEKNLIDQEIKILFL